MTRLSRRAAVILLPVALLAPASCGKKGPVLPPFVRVPEAVADLSLSRVGDRLFLSWTDPQTYVDGNPLRALSEIEVWAIEQPAGKDGAPPEKPSAADFEERGRLVMKVPIAAPVPTEREAPPARRESVVLEPDPGALAANTTYFSLRARDDRRRPSEFSDPAVLEPAGTLPPPGGLQASVFEDHIGLAWLPPPAAGSAASPKIAGYNIYRSEGETPAGRLNKELLPSPEFRDGEFSFGRAYTYFVRSAAAGTSVSIESEDSQPVKVEPADRFAPAAPQGLTTVSGEAFVALSWEPSREPDLAGYRVWRRAAGEPEFVLVKELSPAESSFSDAAVESGQHYVYAVTAFDRAGNESGRSVEASGQARSPRA